MMRVLGDLGLVLVLGLVLMWVEVVWFICVFRLLIWCWGVYWLVF